CAELWESTSRAALEGEDWQTPFAELGDLLRRGVREDEALAEAVKLAEKRINATVNVRHVMAREDQVVSVRQVETFVAMLFEVLRQRLPADVAPRLIYELTNAIERGPSAELSWLAKDVEAQPVQAGGRNGHA